MGKAEVRGAAGHPSCSILMKLAQGRSRCLSLSFQRVELIPCCGHLPHLPSRPFGFQLTKLTEFEEGPRPPKTRSDLVR